MLSEIREFLYKNSIFLVICEIKWRRMIDDLISNLMKKICGKNELYFEIYKVSLFWRFFKIFHEFLQAIESIFFKCL